MLYIYFLCKVEEKFSHVFNLFELGNIYMHLKVDIVYEQIFFGVCIFHLHYTGHKGESCELFRFSLVSFSLLYSPFFFVSLLHSSILCIYFLTRFSFFLCYTPLFLFSLFLLFAFIFHSTSRLFVNRCPLDSLQNRQRKRRTFPAKKSIFPPKNGLRHALH